MNAEFLLPDLGEGLPEAEIVQWLVAEGDAVTLNQPIAEVETAKAIVELPSPFAGTVSDLHAAAGDVVAVGAPRSAEISSVSGDLRLNLNSRDVDVETVSGNVSLRGRIGGEISAESVSGDISIDTRGEAARKLSTSSVSGNASYTGALADGGRISAESVSGDIRLTLPKSLSARVHAESFSGSLTAPGVSVSRPKYGPGSSFEHTFGSGSGEIRLETFSGNAELRLE